MLHLRQLVTPQDLVKTLAGGQWWLHKDGWNCSGGGLDKYYNHPVVSYHDVRHLLKC